MWYASDMLTKYMFTFPGMNIYSAPFYLHLPDVFALKHKMEILTMINSLKLGTKTVSLS